MPAPGAPIGNQYAKGNNAGRPSKMVRMYQAKVGLHIIIPYLEKHNLIPKALQNIGDIILNDNLRSVGERKERLYWSGWVIDKFLPAIQNIDLTAEQKIDFGEKLNELLTDVFARLPQSGNNGGISTSNVSGDVPQQT